MTDYGARAIKRRAYSPLDFGEIALSGSREQGLLRSPFSELSQARSLHRSRACSVGGATMSECREGPVIVFATYAVLYHIIGRARVLGVSKAGRIGVAQPAKPFLWQRPCLPYQFEPFVNISAVRSNDDAFWVESWRSLGWSAQEPGCTSSQCFVLRSSPTDFCL
jgi:hypothetical protein